MGYYRSVNVLFACNFRSFSDIHYSGGSSKLQVKDGKMISETSQRLQLRNFTIPRDGYDHEVESIVNNIPSAYFIWVCVYRIYLKVKDYGGRLNNNK